MAGILSAAATYLGIICMTEQLTPVL